MSADNLKDCTINDSNGFPPVYIMSDVKLTFSGHTQNAQR